MKRKLAGVFCVDVAGYSRLTGVDEEGTRLLSEYLDTMTEAIPARNGEALYKDPEHAQRALSALRKAGLAE